MILKSYCYGSKKIREAIKKGIIIGNDIDEDQIQPSSFDPTIGNEVYIVDSEYSGIFRNPQRESVYKSLYRLSNRQRQKLTIDKSGFELKKGFSYLVPLNESVKLPKDTYIRNSPKSSLGRIFINSRLISDYNPCLNEVNATYCQDQETKLWLYIQPLAFNVIIFPGISLNQLRFFKGYSAQLSPIQLIQELKKHPLLYTLDSKENLIPANPIVTDGITIHLNLSGIRTYDIVGLRARQNPIPIDISKKNTYTIEDYFEPITRKKRIVIKSGEYYLMASREILKVPKHLSMEVRDYSHIGFSGPLHFAGFIDNGFEGDLVYEVRSDELTKELELQHNMPISKLDVYHTTTPDKLYGFSNNNYQFQIGPKTSKYFSHIDYKYIAKKYTKLDDEVLVVDKNIIINKLKARTGFIQLNEKEKEDLFNEFKYGFYQSRYNCESDELVMQITVYLLIKKGKKILTYQKVDNLESYPEDRLFLKQSLGIWAHIIKNDSSNMFFKAVKRTLKTKNISLTPTLQNIDFLGVIFTEKNIVDRFHLGLVFIANVKDIKVKANSIAKNWEFVSVKQLSTLRKEKDFETWGDILIQNIESFT